MIFFRITQKKFAELWWYSSFWVGYFLFTHVFGFYWIFTAFCDEKSITVLLQNNRIKWAKTIFLNCFFFPIWLYVAKKGLGKITQIFGKPESIYKQHVLKHVYYVLCLMFYIYLCFMFVWWLWRLWSWKHLLIRFYSTKRDENLIIIITFSSHPLSKILNKFQTFWLRVNVLPKSWELGNRFDKNYKKVKES